MKAIPFRMQRKSRLRAFFYLAALIMLLAEAMPKLPRIELTAGGVFAAGWLVLALLAIGSQLYTLMNAGSQSAGSSVSISRSDLQQMREASKRYREREFDR